MIATSGRNAIAGNGANGTKTLLPSTITSLGPVAKSSQTRPWRNASAR
jgi:hypothetical protein